MEKQRQQELAELKPTAEMMDEEQFWAIVQTAVDEAGDDEDEYLEVVKRELSVTIQRYPIYTVHTNLSNLK